MIFMIAKLRILIMISQNQKYICFANAEVEPQIYILCSEIEYEEIG